MPLFFNDSAYLLNMDSVSCVVTPSNTIRKRILEIEKTLKNKAFFI